MTSHFLRPYMYVWMAASSICKKTAKSDQTRVAQPQLVKPNNILISSCSCIKWLDPTWQIKLKAKQMEQGAFAEKELGWPRVGFSLWHNVTINSALTMPAKSIWHYQIGTITQHWVIGQQIRWSTTEISQCKKSQSIGVGSQVGSPNLNPQLTSSDSNGHPWHKRACPGHCFEAIAAIPETNQLHFEVR